MSLLDKMKTEFVRLDKTTTSGEFGQETVWKEGATFFATAEYLSSTAERVAEVDKKISNWKIIVSPDVDLEKNDVIKRLSDGKTLKIDISNENIETPEVATFKFKQAFAFEFSTSANARV